MQRLSKALAAATVVALMPVAHAGYRDIDQLPAPTSAAMLVYAPAANKLILKNSASAIAVLDIPSGSSSFRYATTRFNDMTLSPSGRYVFATDYGGENIGYGTPAAPQYVIRLDTQTGIWEQRTAFIAGHVQAVSDTQVVLKSVDQWVTFTNNAWGDGPALTVLNSSSGYYSPGYFAGVYYGNFRYLPSTGRLLHGSAGSSSQEIQAFKVGPADFVKQEGSGTYGTAQGYGGTTVLATDGSAFYYGTLQVDPLDVSHNLRVFPEPIYAADADVAFGNGKYYNAHTGTLIGTLPFATTVYGLNPGGGDFWAYDPATTTLHHFVHPAQGPDLNGDRKADLVYRNVATGQVYRLGVNGLSVSSGAFVYTEPNLAWLIVADADFNGDGVTDLLWRNNSTGQVYMQFFGAGGMPTGGAFFWTEPNPAWRIVATPDFDGDGEADLLWWNSVTGQVYAMQLDGSAILAQGNFFTQPDTQWTIAAVGDFSGSGKRNQILWHNAATGQVSLMTVSLSGGMFSQTSQVVYTAPTTSWKIVAAADFNGDSKDDMLWRNESTGDVQMLLMDGSAILAHRAVYQEPNTAWKIVAVGDYNADGRADVLWRNDSTGQVYMMLMNGTTIASQGMVYREANTAWHLLGPLEYAH